MPYKPANVDEQYKKDPNLKKEDVAILEQWLLKQPHLPKITELQIILFLHSCNFRIEQAKTTIDNYFTVRTLCPEIFACPSIDVIKHTLEVAFYPMLPERTPKNEIVLICKLTDTKPDSYIHINHINVVDMICCLKMHEDGVNDGLHIIIDLTGSGFGHMTRVNLGALKKHLCYLQEAVCVKITAIHFINLNSFLDSLMSMIKPFISKDLYALISFHSNIETLYKSVPKRMLPAEYGGEAGTTKEMQAQVMANVLDKLDFFALHDAQKVDESKRVVEKNTSIDAVFGASGTFKKLSFD